jgi:PAS domain S-box-containing protein
MSRIELTPEEKAAIYEKRFDESLIGRCIVSKDFVFQRVNATLCQYLGVTHGELLGKKFTDITPSPIKEIDLANAYLVIERVIERYRLPKVYQWEGTPRKVYVIIDVLGMYQENGDFKCFDVDILMIDRKTYKQEVRTLLRAHLKEGFQETLVGRVSLSSMPKLSFALLGVMATIVIITWEISQKYAAQIKDVVDWFAK